MLVVIASSDLSFLRLVPIKALSKTLNLRSTASQVVREGPRPFLECLYSISEYEQVGRDREGLSVFFRRCRFGVPPARVWFSPFAAGEAGVCSRALYREASVRTGSVREIEIDIRRTLIFLLCEEQAVLANDRQLSRVFRPVTSCRDSPCIHRN